MQSIGSSILGTLGLLLLVGLLLYLYLGLTLMLIARRSNTPNAGLAFLPIGNLFLMCQIGRRPGWWVLLLLIPIINVAVFAMIWISIAEVREKPVWTGAFAAIPLAGLIVPLYFAVGQAQIPRTVAARICTACGVPVLGLETFCRNCGHAAPPPMLARRLPTGQLALMGTITSVVALALIGGIAWFTLFRGLSYTAPDRKSPEIPTRLAGTMTEFPVDTGSDTDAGGKMEPGSVVTQDFSGTGGATNSSQQVPQKWLPPGVTRQRLPQVAGTMTSTTYQPRRPKGGAAAPVSPEIYIHVLRALQNQAAQLTEELARSVAQATGGSRSGVRVQSPRGPVYTGSRIQSPQSSVYVLTRQDSDIVILIYGASAAAREATARLASNVGNGEGLNDSPTMQTTLWTLPRQPPTDFVLQGVNTISGDELFSSADFQSAGKDEQTRELINKVRQFIPEQITTARYRDPARREWTVNVYDYDSTRRAWNTWFLLRWTLGLGGQSTTVMGSDGLYLDTDQGRLLLFQRGPYLIAIQGPASAAVPILVDFGNRLQV